MPSDRPDTRVAHGTTFAFVEELLGYGESYPGQPGDVVEVEAAELPGGGVHGTVVAGPPTLRVRTDDGVEVELPEDAWVHVEASPAIDGAWDRHLAHRDPDGVAWADDAVPNTLRARLRAHVERLVTREPVDFHPGSGTRVRDLVHPSLYPYVEGRSRVVGPRPPRLPWPARDRFGRPFEGSRFQWLPTPFRVDEHGETRIVSTIHHLDPTRYAALYTDLERLFSCALPLVESVLGTLDATRFWHEDLPDHADEGDLPDPPDLRTRVPPPRSLRGRELQVIPKIVEYRLERGETHEGVWHVEGMSHEHVVATCLYVVERDAALLGGDLQYQRAYTIEEAGRLFWTIDQSRPPPVNRLVERGMVPVGSVGTPAGRLIVFPNSHVHRLTALTVASGAAEARRRVIVFWVVDPDVRLLSTREVPPQQGVMSHEEALAIRLELMEERRRHKQTLNPRVVSLCEH